MAAERKLKRFLTKITTTDGIILDKQLQSDTEGIMHYLNKEITDNPTRWVIQAAILGPTNSSLKTKTNIRYAGIQQSIAYRLSMNTFAV